MDEEQPIESSTEAPPVQPPRRRHLRLVVLLLLLIALCGTLGGWHVYSTHFAPYVEAAEPAVEGEPLLIRGGYVDFLGFDEENFALDVSEVHPDGRRVLSRSANGRADRRGLWNYDFEVTLDGVAKSGEYDIEVRPMTRAVHSRRTFTDSDSIRGKLVVSRPK